MKRGTLFILVVLLLPTLSAITGEATQSPTNVSVFVEPSAPIIKLFSPEAKTYDTTTVLLNYSVKNSLESVWYNLDNSQNISLGNFTDSSTIFNTTLGSHTLYFYANNSYGLRTSSVNFVISEQSSPPSGDTGGGSGSGGGGGGTAVSSYFEISKNFLEVTFHKGESQRETIEIKNTASKPITIKIFSEDLSEFVLVDVEELTLSPQETKEVGVNFFSLSKILPGVYAGRIVFSSENTKKTVNVFINLKDSNALFDLNLEVLPKFKSASPGKTISVLLDMTNIGLSGTAVDVELFLYLTDADKEEIFEYSKETLAVKTDLSVTRKIKLPQNLEEGTYLLIGELKYNNISASSYDTIDISNKQTPVELIQLFLWVTISVLLLIIAFLLFKGRKNKKNKK